MHRVAATAGLPSSVAPSSGGMSPIVGGLLGALLVIVAALASAWLRERLRVHRIRSWHLPEG
jgi:uncharacterized protein involved in exopolysaccharide biosynthesis